MYCHFVWFAYSTKSYKQCLLFYLLMLSFLSHDLISSRHVSQKFFLEFACTIDETFSRFLELLYNNKLLLFDDKSNTYILFFFYKIIIYYINMNYMSIDKCLLKSLLLYSSKFIILIFFLLVSAFLIQISKCIRIQNFPFIGINYFKHKRSFSE